MDGAGAGDGLQAYNLAGEAVRSGIIWGLLRWYLHVCLGSPDCLCLR